MPRWKELPEELDPEVKEFAEQLRTLVDRSGLSISAVSDSTGYSKTSWERYLNGRILAPKGAVVALAEVTGTSPIHLTTMWELAERAWSRAEQRHDRTMEQIRITQARAALGEYGADSASASGSGGSSRGGGGQRRRTSGSEPATPTGWPPYDTDEALSSSFTRPTPPPGAPGGRSARRSTAPAGTGRRAAPGRRDSGSGPGRGGPNRAGGKRRIIMFLSGVVGALVVIVGAFLLTDLGGKGEKTEKAVKAVVPTAPTEGAELPAGVKCTGDDCAGQDPEIMGCGGEFAKTVASATFGKAVVEVRHSDVCAASWARIKDAAPGDTVEINVAGKGKQNGLVNADNDAYTPMTSVPKGKQATACALFKATGARSCTDK
ncbi:DUF2690 domain-containing protein [Streptomyces sp. CAU 1734]|uniref:helix-turn-helix domain-containing protein n=1 Tax=Streptomyces sp. CAU 1734 TaxID=3140360 RepID=UPI0032615342